VTKRRAPRRRASDNRWINKFVATHKFIVTAIALVVLGASGTAWYVSPSDLDEVTKKTAENETALADHKKKFWEQLGKLRERIERLERRHPEIDL